MAQDHQHESEESQERGPYGYDHCLSPGDGCNPAAHGGVVYHETCECGATRDRASTGLGRTEWSPWVGGDEDAECGCGECPDCVDTDEEDDNVCPSGARAE